MIRKLIKNNWIIILIIFLSLIVRVVGVYPGFTVDHPDEPGSYITAIHMFYNFLMPGRFDYPAGMPLLHLLIYWIFIFPFVFFKIFFPHPDMVIALFSLGFDFFSQFKEAIFGVSGLNALYWSRYIAAFVGTGAVILTYLTAKKLFGKPAGIFAAFFLVFNFRHVLASHFALPDIHSSFFNILTLYASVLLFEKNTRGRYIFAGIAAALALSMKYQPLAYLPFFVVHILWAIKKKSFWYLFYKDFILGMIASFITFVIVNPYYFLNIENAIMRNKQDYIRYGMGQLYLRMYQYFYLFHWGIGKLPAITIIFGIIFMLFKSFRKFLIVFSFVSAFFFVTTYYSSAYPRNFTAVMPFLMIFAGFFMDFLYQRLRKINIKLSIVLITAIIAIFNFSSIKNAIILDINYSKEWNFVPFNKWLQKYLPQNVTARVYDISPTHQTRLAFENKNILLKSWDYTQGPNSLAEFQEEGTQFAILDTATFQLATYWWRGWNDPKRFLKFDNIPFDYIQNSYFGLSIKELMPYTVYELYKPWQAQDVRNYLVFKIPQKPQELGNKVVAFNFDKGDDGWKPVNPFDLSPMDGGWVKEEGQMSPGSLVIKSVGDMTQRLGSMPIKIKSGRLYTVKGFMKSDKVIDPEAREGFIRIDMYKNIDTALKNKLGDVVGMTARVYKTGDWIEEKISLIAPKDIKYLVISFQKSHSSGSPDYLDDVELFESGSVLEESFGDLPYVKSTIPLESIYYNSFL